VVYIYIVYCLYIVYIICCLYIVTLYIVYILYTLYIVCNTGNTGMGWLRLVSSLKISGLFYRIYSLLWGSVTKETYNLMEPTNRSHPIICITYETI